MSWISGFITQLYNICGGCRLTLDWHLDYSVFQLLVCVAPSLLILAVTLVAKLSTKAYLPPFSFPARSPFIQPHMIHTSRRCQRQMCIARILPLFDQRQLNDGGFKVVYGCNGHGLAFSLRLLPRAIITLSTKCSSFINRFDQPHCSQYQRLAR